MDLEFNVAQLMKEAVGAHRSYDFAEADLLLSPAINPDDYALTAHDITGHVKFTRLNGRLRAEGQVQATIGMRCSRCLDEFTAPISAPIEELFVQTHDVSSGLPLPHDAGDEDDGLVIDRNHIVNLAEPIRQTLLVSLPLQPLCRESCAGLCPQCGQNWNEGPCECPTETLDPRLAALADLLTDERIAQKFSNN